MAEQPAGAADIAAANDLATEALQAAEKEPTPAKARRSAAQSIRRTADRVKFELSDDDVNRIADALVNQMEARGAFEPPPEPMQAPPPAHADEISAASPVPTIPEAPQRRTFAERFRGNG